MVWSNSEQPAHVKVKLGNELAGTRGRPRYSIRELLGSSKTSVLRCTVGAFVSSASNCKRVSLETKMESIVSCGVNGSFFYTVNGRFMCSD
jgi:hypothetical protein